MKSAVIYLVGESPYSQSKHYDKEDVPAKQKELHDAYEKRTWRNRVHSTPDGFVQIPGICVANSIKEAAKRLQLQVPGKARTTYTKYFEAGIMIPDNLKLPIRAAEVPADKLFVPSDGRRGGGKRVYKWFPRIDQWEGEFVVYIVDDLITEDVFLNVLTAAGMLVGIGRFRPQNCGFYGRFSVKSIRWLDEAETMKAIGSAA